MSFILDALKKSESERHRHSGPVLMDVRIAPPRRRLPVWAWVIAGVLLANVLLLVWVLWLAPDHRVAAPTSAVAPAAVPQVVAPSAAAPAASPAPQVAAPVVSAAPPPGTTSPSATEPSATTPAAAAVVPPPAATVTPPPANAPAIDTANLPRVQDLIASGAALPELRLSLHVFDATPANRYVLLNGTRLHEGEFTPEGVKVLQIAPAGVVLEWRGRRMFLSAGG